MVIAIQARILSSRLPGKIMMDIDGRPLIRVIYDRIKTSFPNIKCMIVTGPISNNKELSLYCNEYRIPIVHHYNEDDVLGRYASLDDDVVRITGDSPFVQPDLINEAIDIFKITGDHIVTNTAPRCVPSGFEVEIVPQRMIDNLNLLNIDKKYREHVTLWYYDIGFPVINPPTKYLKYLKYKLSVDTQEDYDLCKKIFNSGINTFNPIEIIEKYEELRVLTNQ